MKNEAVTMRPTEIIKTARVGYQASGTGLVTGFGACKSMIHEFTKCKMVKTMKFKKQIWIEFKFTHHEIRWRRRKIDSKEISLVVSTQGELKTEVAPRRKNLGMEYFRVIFAETKKKPNFTLPFF